MDVGGVAEGVDRHRGVRTAVEEIRVIDGGGVVMTLPLLKMRSVSGRGKDGGVAACWLPQR